MTTAIVALGSNLGKRQVALRAALERLGRVEQTRVVAAARFRETEPVGCAPGMRRFLNSAVKIETFLEAPALLEHLLRIERELGRTRATDARPAARTIDLDLILFGDLIIQTADLVIPHPRMHERLFVLEAAAEIAPELRHPLFGKRMRELFHEMNSKSVAGEIVS